MEYHFEENLTPEILNILGQDNWLLITSYEVSSNINAYFGRQSPATSFVVSHPTNPEGNFSIFKNYTYGEITLIFLGILISIILIFNTISNLFIVKKIRLLETFREKY